VERRQIDHQADLDSATGEGYVAPKKDELKIIMAGRVLEDRQTVRDLRTKVVDGNTLEVVTMHFVLRPSRTNGSRRRKKIDTGNGCRCAIA